MIPRSSWVAGLLGAALVGIPWLVLDSNSSTAPSSSAGLVGDREVLQRLERIERSLGDVQEALGARVSASASTTAPEGPSLEGSAPAAQGESAPSATAAGPAITEELLARTLERTLERQEEKKTAGLNDQQLQAEARRLLNRERDFNGARRLYELLLKRDLAPAVRVEALTDLGSANRELQDYAASERALRQAMNEAGTDSGPGVTAGYHLVWTYGAAQRPGDGLALADQLLGSRGATDAHRPWLRWAAARMAFDAGEKDRARTDFRALLAEYKDNAAFRQIAQDAVERLRRLE